MSWCISECVYFTENVCIVQKYVCYVSVYGVVNSTRGNNHTLENFYQTYVDVSISTLTRAIFFKTLLNHIISSLGRDNDFVMLHMHSEENWKMTALVQNILQHYL